MSPSSPVTDISVHLSGNLNNDLQCTVKAPCDRFWIFLDYFPQLEAESRSGSALSLRQINTGSGRGGQNTDHNSANVAQSPGGHHGAGSHHGGSASSKVQRSVSATNPQKPTARRFSTGGESSSGECVCVSPQGTQQKVQYNTITEASCRLWCNDIFIVCKETMGFSGVQE